MAGFVTFSKRHYLNSARSIQFLIWAEPISSDFFFGFVGPWPVTGPITSAFLAYFFSSAFLAAVLTGPGPVFAGPGLFKVLGRSLFGTHYSFGPWPF